MPLSLQTFPTVGEAAAALGARTRYLGGGTLVVRACNEGDLSCDTLVRTSDPALRRIEIADRNVLIGASVTMAAVTRHPALSALAAAAGAVGGPAIRNMATVGGNLFAPTPYGDFTVAMLALGAQVEIGGKTMDLDAFLRVRERLDGIVAGVNLRLPAAEAFRFVKIARVRPKGVSILSIAAVIEADVTGTVEAACIALGCMADRPIRARKAEEALIGAQLTEHGVQAAVEAVTEGVSPPTDAVASAWYRREILPVHFRRLLLSRNGPDSPVRRGEGG